MVACRAQVTQDPCTKLVLPSLETKLKFRFGEGLRGCKYIRFIFYTREHLHQLKPIFLENHFFATLFFQGGTVL